MLSPISSPTIPFSSLLAASWVEAQQPTYRKSPSAFCSLINSLWSRRLELVFYSYSHAALAVLLTFHPLMPAPYCTLTPCLEVPDQWESTTMVMTFKTRSPTIPTTMEAQLWPTPDPNFSISWLLTATTRPPTSSSRTSPAFPTALQATLTTTPQCSVKPVIQTALPVSINQINAKVAWKATT